MTAEKRSLSAGSMSSSSLSILIPILLRVSVSLIAMLGARAIFLDLDGFVFGRFFYL